MKKLVISCVIVLLAVACWAGATYYVGGQVEKTHAQLFERFARVGPFSFTVSDYRRGFASSTARVVMEMKIPKAPTDEEQAPEEDFETVRLVFAETLKHGPLPGGFGPGLATVETRLVDVSPGNEELARLQAEVPAFREALDVTRIGFDGTLRSAVRVPRFRTTGEAGTFDWGGLAMNLTWSPSRRTLAGNVDLAGFVAELNDGRIAWEGVKAEMDLVETLPLLYVGKSRARSGALSMDLPGKTDERREQFTLKGIEVTSASSYDGHVVNVTQVMNFAGVDVRGETYGPGLLDIEMRNLDGQVLSDVQQQIYDLYGSAETIHPDQLAGQLIGIYGQMGLRLLEQSPEFNVRAFRFATPRGEIDGSLQVRYDASRGGNAEVPAALLQAVEAKADLSLHENLARLFFAEMLDGQLKKARSQGQLPDTFSDADIEELAMQQAASQIEGVLAQNLAVRDGDLLRSAATFNNGELVVNGRSLPLFQ